VDSYSVLAFPPCEDLHYLLGLCHKPGPYDLAANVVVAVAAADTVVVESDCALMTALVASASVASASYRPRAAHGDCTVWQVGMSYPRTFLPKVQEGPKQRVRLSSSQAAKMLVEGQDVLMVPLRMQH